VSEPDVPARAGPARTPVPAITREELQSRLESPAPPALFEVLPRGYWRKNHLPGALNAPPDQAVEIITAHVPDKGAEIVVYCWDDG
jgi:rhodanese-related sulfurtransferase